MIPAPPSVIAMKHLTATAGRGVAVALTVAVEGRVSEVVASMKVGVEAGADLETGIEIENQTRIVTEIAADPVINTNIRQHPQEKIGNHLLPRLHLPLLLPPPSHAGAVLKFAFALFRALLRVVACIKPKAL
jgi:hypothetical protein